MSRRDNILVLADQKIRLLGFENARLSNKIHNQRVVIQEQQEAFNFALELLKTAYDFFATDSDAVAKISKLATIYCFLDAYGPREFTDEEKAGHARIRLEKQHAKVFQRRELAKV